jgi:hypothetical protein
MSCQTRCDGGIPSVAASEARHSLAGKAPPFPRPKSVFIEDAGNLVGCVVIEQAVHFGDHRGRRVG